MPALPIDAITFDYWDTLMVAKVDDAHRSRLAACASALEQGGHPVGSDALDTALRGAFRAYQESWRAGVQFGAPDFVASCLTALELPGSLHDALVEAVVADSGTHVLQQTPNIGETLTNLRRAGLQIGIICDVAITSSAVLRSKLDEGGLLGLFDHWSFSDEVGHYKPSPVVFAHAAEGLGVSDPSRICHVGDLRRTDVAGARAAGWHSVRYAGVTDDTGDGPEAEFVVRDHLELVTLTGCG